MATYRITAPDGTQYSVSGNGTQEEALAHFQQNWQPEQAPVKPALEPTRGVYSSPALRERQYRMDNPQPASPWDMGTPDMGRGIVGAGEAALSLGSGAISTPVAGIVGGVAAPFSEDPAGLIESIRQRFTYQPRTQAGEQATAAVAYPFEKLAQGADRAGDFVNQAIRSPLLASATNTSIQALPAILFKGGELVRGRVGNALSRPTSVGSDLVRSEGKAAVQAVPKAERQAGLGTVLKDPPTIEELTAQKNAAYQAAENTGVVVKSAALNRLKVQLVNDLKKEGMNQKLHPKAWAAAQEITQNTKGPLTLSQIETLRKIANDAKGSIEPADSRLGARIVDKLDDFEETLSQSDISAGDAAAATAFKDARALNTRLAKAKTIQRLFDRAELTAPNFSGSGMENALRTEFRALAKNDREMRRFTPEEKDAIKKVALGGPMENTLRQLGKLAPTGVVSAGMGAMAGAMVGGPVGAAAVPAAGFAARSLATRMTMKNANAAFDMMRRGPQKQPVVQPEVVGAQ